MTEQEYLRKLSTLTQEEIEDLRECLERSAQRHGIKLTLQLKFTLHAQQALVLSNMEILKNTQKMSTYFNNFQQSN